MNRETAIVYLVATVVAVLVGMASSVAVGIVAGLATIGGIVVAWHLFDAIRDAIASHYEKKFAPKDKKEVSAL